MARHVKFLYLSLDDMNINKQYYVMAILMLMKRTHLLYERTIYEAPAEVEFKKG